MWRIIAFACVRGGVDVFERLFWEFGAVLGEAVVQQDFLDEVADTVWAICEESAWQLPAHNSYVRDTPQLPLPDTTRPIVDLFAAETAGD